MHYVPWICLRLRVTRCRAERRRQLGRVHACLLSVASPTRRPMFMLAVARRDRFSLVLFEIRFVFLGRLSSATAHALRSLCSLL